MDSEIRIDQWLWASRFFKTRALANTAIKTGRVLINQGRCKPSRSVNIDDKILIQKAADLTFEVIVKSLEKKRVSAKIAAGFYKETPESIEKREQADEIRKLANQLVHYPDDRPDKRDRRILRKIRHSSE